MSQSPALSRNTSPSRPHSGCVAPRPSPVFQRSMVDDLLREAWDSLPDATLTEPKLKPVGDHLADARNFCPSEDDERRFSQFPNRTQQLAAAAEALPSARSPRAVATPSPRSVVAPLPPSVSAVRAEVATPVAATQRPPIAIVPPSERTYNPRPMPSANFPMRRQHSHWALGIEDLKKWGSGLVAVALLVVARDWGVSTVSESSGSSLKTIAVQGTVTWNGKPVPGASIQLHPVLGSKTPQDIHPQGVVGKDNQVEFTTYQPKDGVPVGEYVATVSCMQIKVVDGETVAGPQLAPAIYTQASTSPLRVKVSSETRKLPPLEIKQQAKVKAARYESE